MDKLTNTQSLDVFVQTSKFNSLILSGKEMDAVELIRDMEPRVGLRVALSIVRSFSEEMK